MEQLHKPQVCFVTLCSNLKAMNKCNCDQKKSKKGYNLQSQRLTCITPQSRFFLILQFCEVGDIANVHKKTQPNLALCKRGMKKKNNVPILVWRPIGTHNLNMKNSNIFFFKIWHFGNIFSTSIQVACMTLAFCHHNAKICHKKKP